MRKLLIALVTVAVLIALNPVYSTATGPQGGLGPEMGQAREALSNALAELGVPKGDKNLLILTNAGYGQIGPQTTEPFLDVAQDVTGCSPGRRSLLIVHTSIQEPLWAALYRKAALS